MNVCVCLSCVPETTYRVKVDPKGNSLDYSNSQFILNPLDNYTLTKAIQLKSNSNMIGSITLLTVGNQSCDPILKKSLAMGADHAIRINIEPTDSFTVSQNISKFLEEKKYDLVFMGKESIDYNGGITPSITAELSGYQFIENCIAITIQNQSLINAIVENSEGTTTELEATTPLIITAQKGLVKDHEIIIPNMRALMSARQKDIEIIETKNIPSPFTKTISYETNEQKKETKYFTLENLEELADIIYTEYKNK